MRIEDVVGKIQKNIINIVVLGVCILIGLNVYKGQKNIMANMENQKNTEIQKNEVLATIGRLERRWKVYKRQVNTRTDGSEKNDVGIVDTLNSFAKETNIRNMVLRKMPEEDNRGYKRMGLSLNFSVDSYHTLGKFISLVENSGDFLMVESLTVRQDLSENRPVLFVELQVNTITVTD